MGDQKHRKITKKYAYLQKKCRKIWSIQKKAVLLHPLFAKRCLAPQKKETLSGLFFVPMGTRTRVLISLRSNDYCAAIFDSRWHHKKETLSGLFFGSVSICILICCAYLAFLIRFANEIAPAGHTKRHKWHPTHLLPTTRGLRSSPNSIAW